MAIRVRLIWGEGDQLFLHVFGGEGVENVFFAAANAPRKIFEHFFEIFVKFVNKNAI